MQIGLPHVPSLVPQVCNHGLKALVHSLPHRLKALVQGCAFSMHAVSAMLVPYLFHLLTWMLSESQQKRSILCCEITLQEH